MNIITKVIPPASFAVITHIRKNDETEEEFDGTNEENEVMAGSE
jgi:hypothetical protein